MKICILTPRFPFPENGGDVLRINNIARYLKKKGHVLILVSYFAGDSNIETMSERLYDKIYRIKHSKFTALGYSLWAFFLGKPIQIGYYFSLNYLFNFKNIIKKEKPDLYISHLLRMVPYLNLCHLRAKSIVEMTDALSKTYGISNTIKGFSIKKIIYGIEMKRIVEYEKKAIASYKKCVLVSEADKKYLDDYIAEKTNL
jgi:hypothetical protein